MKDFPAIDDPKAVAEQARSHHARLNGLLQDVHRSSGNLPLMQRRLADLLPFIKAKSRIDNPGAHPSDDEPLDEETYAGHLSVAIGDLINSPGDSYFPEIWRQALTAYFDAGYFELEEFDALVYPIPDACTMLEKAMRVGSGTAAATFIELGADISRVPHEDITETDLATRQVSIKIQAGDFDALVNDLRAQYPDAMTAVLGALMRRTMATTTCTPSARNAAMAEPGPALPLASRRRAAL